MKTFITTLLLTGLFSISYAQDTSELDSAALAKQKLKEYESLLMNKWWIPVVEKSEANALKQNFATMGKYRTIGVTTGSWGWRDKVNMVLYVDYVGQKWTQKIIKLTDTEFVYERGGKKYVMKKQ